MSWMQSQPGCPCGNPLEEPRSFERHACQQLRSEIMADPPQVFYGSAIHALRNEVLSATGQTACMRCLHPTGGSGQLCRYCAEEGP